MEHSHVMGGSSAAQRIHCPGSLQLEKSLDLPDESSEFAKRGTMLHSAIENLIETHEFEADIDDLNAWFEMNEGNSFGEGEGYELTRKLFNTKILPAYREFQDIGLLYKIESFQLEQKVSLEEHIPGGFGTSDLIAIDYANNLHILDWKFGDGVPVPVEENFGLAFYAAGALYSPSTADYTSVVPGDGVVFFHIVQPRVGSDEVRQTWDTTIEWIEDFLDQAINAAKLALTENPPVKAGSWCRWCDAKAICPVRKDAVGEAINAEPKSMTTVELGKAMEMANLAKSWSADVYKLVQAELERGVNVPGWKLVQKRPARVYNDPAEVEKLLKRKKLKVDEMYEKKLLSPAKIEKVLGKQRYEKILTEHVSMHSSGLTIAPADDKRQAVSNSTALFANAMDKAGKTEG